MPLLACGLSVNAVVRNRLGQLFFNHQDEAIAFQILETLNAFGTAIPGLTMMISISEGVNRFAGHQTTRDPPLQLVAYQSVYVSYIILGAVGVVLTVLFVREPQSDEPSIRERKKRPSGPVMLTLLSENGSPWGPSHRSSRDLPRPTPVSQPRGATSINRQERARSHRISKRTSHHNHHVLNRLQPNVRQHNHSLHRMPFTSTTSRLQTFLSSTSSITAESRSSRPSTDSSSIRWSYFDRQILAYLTTQQARSSTTRQETSRLPRSSHIIYQDASWHV